MAFRVRKEEQYGDSFPGQRSICFAMSREKMNM